MVEKTLEERVAALENQMQGKTLQQHFREHAELFDQMFAYRFEEFKRELGVDWDARLAAFEGRQDAKWDKRFTALEDILKLILSRQR